MRTTKLELSLRRLRTHNTVDQVDASSDAQGAGQVIGLVSAKGCIKAAAGVPMTKARASVETIFG